MDIKEVREKVRALTKGACRVCPICNGKTCAGEVPGMGGTGTGSGFWNNASALAAIKMNTRLVHSVRNPSTAVEILGLSLSLPLMVAPIGGIAFNLGGAMPEEEYQRAIVNGAVAAGTIAGTPDAAPVEVMRTGLACAKAQGGRALPFIKPWELSEIEEKTDMCVEAGCKVVACDLDSIGLITLRKMGRPAYAKNRAELAEITRAVKSRGLSFIIKGIMCVEDALACLEAGVDGLVVSNHGGRVLDCVPGTAEVLPQIAAAVKGRMALLVDGGVRTGLDVLKMLALGADCVMVARPFAMAAIAGGEEGVAALAGQYKSQLEQAMIMTGCQDVTQAGPHLLYQ